MLLITGEAKYADLLERTLYNGFLAGTSLDGQRYIYANPLQVRDDHLGAGSDQDYRRVPWFHCACCPPNVMRLLASLEHYVLLGGADRVVLHQYVEGRFGAGLAGGGMVTLEVTTDYPWDGQVTVRVVECPAGVWELALRVPAWAQDVALSVNGEPVGSNPDDGWWAVSRPWRPGDEVVLELPLVPRFTAADPRVDAARGTVALERGPLVYCLESADHPGRRLDDLTLDPSVVPEVVTGEDVLAGVATLRAAGRTRPRTNAGWWPYRSASPTDRPAEPAGEPVELRAVPTSPGATASPVPCGSGCPPPEYRLVSVRSRYGDS
jgi:DUF1680 family protein